MTEQARERHECNDWHQLMQFEGTLLLIVENKYMYVVSCDLNTRRGKGRKAQPTCAHVYSRASTDAGVCTDTHGHSRRRISQEQHHQRVHVFNKENLLQKSGGLRVPSPVAEEESDEFAADPFSWNSM